MEALASSSIAIMPEFSTQNLANTAWAFATLFWGHRPLLSAISFAALRKRQFSRQDIGNIAWSMAKLEFSHAPLVHVLAAEALPQAAEFTAQDIGIMSWAYAILGVGHRPLFNALSAAAIQRLADFGPQNISNIALAFAMMAFRDDPLMEAIAAAVLPPQVRERLERSPLSTEPRRFGVPLPAVRPWHVPGELRVQTGFEMLFLLNLICHTTH